MGAFLDCRPVRWNVNFTAECVRSDVALKI